MEDVLFDRARLYIVMDSTKKETEQGSHEFLNIGNNVFVIRTFGKCLDQSGDWDHHPLYILWLAASVVSQHARGSVFPLPPYLHISRQCAIAGNYRGAIRLTLGEGGTLVMSRQVKRELGGGGRRPTVSQEGFGESTQIVWRILSLG